MLIQRRKSFFGVTRKMLEPVHFEKEKKNSHNKNILHLKIKKESHGLVCSFCFGYSWERDDSNDESLFFANNKKYI